MWAKVDCSVRNCWTRSRQMFWLPRLVWYLYFPSTLNVWLTDGRMWLDDPNSSGAILRTLPIYTSQLLCISTAHAIVPPP